MLRSEKNEDRIRELLYEVYSYDKKSYSTKKQYEIPEGGVETVPIDCNKTEEEYKNFIIKLMTERGGIREKDAILYTRDMSNYILAITHDSVNPDNKAENYEILEHIGDATVNKCTTWYLKNRFPDIVKMGTSGVQILSKQKMLLVSKAFLSSFGTQLGLSDYIRYRPLKIKSQDQVDDEKAQYVIKDNSMKEDSFEAFFGAMESTIDETEGVFGIGYSIVFSILTSFFDEQIIPTTVDELTDPVTKIKEIFDARRKMGDAYSTERPLDTSVFVSVTLNTIEGDKISFRGEQVFYTEGVSYKIALRKATDSMLSILQNLGINYSKKKTPVSIEQIRRLFPGPGR